MKKIKAFTNDNGECLICGETKKCPGWHTTGDLEMSRPDALEYLAQATKEIADEQGYRPESPAAFKKWMEENRQAIGERASQLQWDLLNKLTKHGVQAKVTTAISIAVWARLRQREIAEEANRAIKQLCIDTVLDLERAENML